jgi:SAM-dependent methyltransferase
VSTLGRGFDGVADLYDEVRPAYPDELYDALDLAVGGLHDANVLDLAAGTGIATRVLVGRGARVVALDPGESMLRRLCRVSPSAVTVVAAAERLPLREGSVDLVTCATAWHWFDTDLVVEELRRVLRRGGHVAMWWANNRWHEGIDWEDAKSAVYERWQTSYGSRPPSTVGVGPRDAAADLRARGLDVVLEREFTWTRQRSREEHVRALATHSDVIALGAEKDRFLAEVLDALEPWPVVMERLWGPLVIARV